jgi:NNP family nitrate/nitrite transporter-like MFS transporter
MTETAACSLNRPPELAYPAQGNNLQLAMAAISFGICWTLYGSVSAMMPLVKAKLDLDPIQVSTALAMPVLMATLGRIPLGMLTDRYGGRIVFAWTLLLASIPAFLNGMVSSYPQLLVQAFFAGLALASLPIGIGFISRWFPQARHGYALGLYGIGNVGQPVASLAAPAIAAAIGFAWGFWTWGAIALVWLAVFLVFAKDAPGHAPVKSLSETLEPLKDIHSWEIGLYYFLTFGGFVALSSYLPTMLTDRFHMTPPQAGLVTAGLVIIQPFMRPVGGSLADRYGSYKVLWIIYPILIAMALVMSSPDIRIFSIGAMVVSVCFGLGNGATMKLVPLYFPRSVGVVAGLVGAMGSLGGFFPAKVMGYIKASTGDYTMGFWFLSAFAAMCLLVAIFRGRTASRLQVA